MRPAPRTEVGADRHRRACACRRRRCAARKPEFPVGGIAGIDAGNAGAVIAAGADGVAVISALSLAITDPRRGGTRPARRR